MEEAIYPQEPYPMQSPAIMAGHSTEGALRYQLDVENELEVLEHNLRGEKPVVTNGEITWIIPMGFKPHINEIGSASLLATLRMGLSKIFTLSNLEEGAINNMTSSFARTIMDNIHQNWEYYEIRDDTAASIILHTLTDAYYSNLSKARNAKYLKFLSSTTSIQETQHLSQARQQGGEKEGIIGRIFGRKGR